MVYTRIHPLEREGRSLEAKAPSCLQCKFEVSLGHMRSVSEANKPNNVQNSAFILKEACEYMLWKNNAYYDSRKGKILNMPLNQA